MWCIWPTDHVSAISWNKIPKTSALKKNCHEIHYADNEYEYCDLDNVCTSICSGTGVNEYFINDLGYFGQDCESWLLLSELLAEEITVSDIQAFCIELAHLVSRRLLHRSGEWVTDPEPEYKESEVTFPRVDDWTDK